MSASVSQDATNGTSTPPISNAPSKQTLHKMKERWLQIPVDYNSSSLSDFRGLIHKQRILFSDHPEDIQLDDNTLLRRFKQLIGPKTPYNQQINTPQTITSSTAAAQQSLSVLHEEDTISSASALYDDTESVRMENNKPSLDYIGRFWMSDKNCTQCSECGATFHTFRRKHHCRLCGRVFCQTCCSERMNINKFKKLKQEYNVAKAKTSSESNEEHNPGMMRVCVFCSKLKTNDKLLGIGMSYPNNIDLSAIKDIEKKTYNPYINEIYDMHIKYVIKQLCGFENLSTEWQQLIYSYSVRGNETILPDIIHFRTDFNDIRHYVKVKRISGGSISQCLFIDGVICRKNVAHRKMRTDIRNPRILLLDQAIEYHRMNSKFHSFDILLKQNEEYMRMVVNKICDLGPDIVVVSNQVSRLALKEMCRENITLICNVDISTMERIARAINAPIIGSIDHINQLDANIALGHCGHFYVKYYNEDPIGNKGRRTPLMFFDECVSNQHCTILLRGDDKMNLLKVKNVIRLAMHTLYHLNFEKSLLADFKAVIPAAQITNAIILYHKIQNENESHLFLSTSPFISYGGWRRENVINRLKRLHANKEKERFPHLATYPYNHHGIGDNVNELGIWDPFLPNTDNPWICQTLLVNHCRVINQQQCFPPKLKLIDFYTELDINLGQYLVDMFSNRACSNARCKEPLCAHLLTYSHHNKTISIKLNLLKDNDDDNNVAIHRRHPDLANNDNIIQWTRCKRCNFKTAPTPMSDRTFCLSFGKFLEMEFYSNPAIPSALSSSSCKHSIFDDHIKYFAWNDAQNMDSGDMMIEMDSVKKQPFTVFTSKDITTNWSLQFKYYINEMNLLELVQKYVFAAFLVKIDELIALIGKDIPIIRKDLNDLRNEVNDECEKIATQFIDHRDYLHEYYRVPAAAHQSSGSTRTISFLNNKRYHLYRISSEWNELLDGLRRSLLPNESNVDNTNRWMKKFKAPFKGLRSKSPLINLVNNTTPTQQQSSAYASSDDAAEDDKLLDAALQEIDDTIATASHNLTRRSSQTNSGNNTPQITISTTSTPSNIANNEKTYNNMIILSNNTQTTATTSNRANNGDFEQTIRDTSFMVNFNKMFEDQHLITDSPINRAVNNQQLLLSSLKIPTTEAAAADANDVQEMNEGKEDNNNNNNNNMSLLRPQQVARVQSDQSYTSISGASDNLSEYEANAINNGPEAAEAADSDDTKEDHKFVASPSISIATQLFPHVHNADPSAVAMPITMRLNDERPITSLADVDMERLKQESLFLVAACTQNSSDIGSNPCYAHLNLPACFANSVIPIYVDEPSAIIAYTLSSLEYHCVLNNIATQKVRSCRHGGDPSVHDLEKMVNERQKQRRNKVRIELEIRRQNSSFNKKSKDEKSNKEESIAIGEESIENELDLNDLLHHIPKLRNVSKMEYLDEKKEYQSQLKKHGKSSTKLGGLITDSSRSLIADSHHSSRRNDGSQALKFQFIDPGHFNAAAAANNINNAEGSDTFDNENMLDNDNNNNMSTAAAAETPIRDTSSNNKKSYVSTTFSCHVYYPHQFRALRRRLYDDDECDFIESLSRCQSWNTSGGKSGSTFKKTLDHRFVLKFVKQNEFKMFLDNAQSYFEHMASVLFKNYPSVLVHILGVYQISWTKSNSARSNKFAKYVIVMPNLWYSKNITKQFDLKGSLRNRYVSQHTNSSNGSRSKSSQPNSLKTVMLDKNFIEYMRGFPMTLEDQSKQHLHKAVHNDTLFLCKSDVIDYSLLVGINQENNELVVGIIDYLRTYTWDKAVEEQAKSIGMVIGKQAPTIQRPKNYKQRFREAMERYFMVSPDRKTKRINRPKEKSLHDAVRDILIQFDAQS